MQLLDSQAISSRVELSQLRHETRLVTMLFSDVVGSTHLKATLGERKGIRALLRHHEVFRETLAEYKGAEEIGTAGDSFFLIFARPSDAVQFALSVQRKLRGLAQETGHAVLDRIGIHMGEVWVDQTETSSRSKDLFGLQVDLCARVSSLADADQILLTRFPFDTARQALSPHDAGGFESLSWLNHGNYLFKGVEDPIEVCEVGEIGRARLVPPTDSEKATRHNSSDAEPVLGWRPAIGQPIPETSWILDEKLGEGGFGEVWRGHDKVLKSNHVFKFCFRAERARSLKREVTIFRLLKERVGNHPNIVGIENVYFEHPPFYIVMQYIEGRDLTAWFKQEQEGDKAPLELRLRLIAQVADAVQAAHDTGIVHRDIKPSNILVSGSYYDAHAYLTDFGIGNITSDAVLAGFTQFGFTQTVTRAIGNAGTQLYMAPELLVGQTPSIRSDIYSLGVVLYQILVGDFGSPVTSDWPQEIDDPLLREDLQLCFAKDPLKRFAGAGELAARLRSLPRRRAEREQALADQKAEEERQKQILLAKENRRYTRGVIWTAAIEAPLIGAILGWALYFTDDASGVYDYASAFHIPNYIFFVALTSMYFGMDSAMRAYFRDAATAFVGAGRKLSRYILRLCGMISGIVALQTALVALVGNKILEIRGMFWEYFWFSFLIAFCGATQGLLFSSLVKKRESAVRILFLVIMLQLVFGGALIKHDEMNRDLDVISTFKRWLTIHPESNPYGMRDDSVLTVPTVTRFFPVQYGYEALIVAQARRNPLALRQEQIQEQIDGLAEKQVRTEAEAARLEELKDAAPLVGGIEAGSLVELERKLARIDMVIKGAVLDIGPLRIRQGRSGITPERLYANQKVTQLVLKAETEQNDSRIQIPVNPFFSPEKRFGPFTRRQYDWKTLAWHKTTWTLHMSTYAYATLVLCLISSVTLFLFYWSLRLRVAPFKTRQSEGRADWLTRLKSWWRARPEAS
jgi:class 3 adenylate cyclase/tRNA A-37 threonylcarbamoyl transferase component Bud32